MDLEAETRRLLDQLQVLRHASDLDLLVFFSRHPCTLLSSDQIAAFLGYAVKEIAGSLELLLHAGFVTRTPNPRHVARMYVLAAHPPGDGWLPEITRLANTREGRLALIRSIRRRSSDPMRGRTQEADRGHDAGSVPLRFPQGRAAVDKAEPNQSMTSPGAPSESRNLSERGAKR